MTVDAPRLGADLHPVDASERDAFLVAAGHLSREDCPAGFVGHSAVWARDRDLLVGQAALILLADDALRPRLMPAGLPPEVMIGAVDAMAVRAEYRETGLEERMVRHLLGAFVNEPGGPRDALVYVGAARVPVMASVRAGLGPVDEWLR
jgi:hypothetical protein